MGHNSCKIPGRETMENTWEGSHVKYIGGKSCENMREKSWEIHRRKVIKNTWEGSHVKYIREKSWEEYGR